MSENNEAVTITTNALAKKRADLVFETKPRNGSRGFAPSLSTLTPCCTSFDRTFAAEGLPVRHRRRTRSPYFGHGELTRRIYDALRERGVITSRDVADKAMHDKGLDPATDHPTRTDFVRRVTIQLGALARDGKVERTGKGPALRWRLSA